MLPAILVAPESVEYYDTLMVYFYSQIIKSSVWDVLRTLQLQKVA